MCTKPCSLFPWLPGHLGIREGGPPIGLYYGLCREVSRTYGVSVSSETYIIAKLVYNL